MNTLDPILYNFNAGLLVAAVVVGTVLFIIALCMITSDHGGIVFVTALVGALMAAPSALYLMKDGDIDQQATYEEIAEHYDVMLPARSTQSRAANVVRFKIEKDAKQFISLDVLDEKTQEVYEDARIVWDGKEISLLVKAEGSEEYVPLR